MSQQKKESTPAPVFSAEQLAAASAQLKAHERLEAIKAKGFATEPGLYRYIGASVRPLAYELRRLLTDLSQPAPAPVASTEDVFVTGAVLAVNVGDRLPDPQFFEKLSDEESADVVTVQQALGLRTVDRAVEAAESGLGAADQVLNEATAKVAEATRRREQASAARDVAARSCEREQQRLADHLAPYGDGGEEKLRAVLATMKAPKVKAESDHGFITVSRGGGVMERVEAAS